TSSSTRSYGRSSSLCSPASPVTASVTSKFSEASSASSPSRISSSSSTTRIDPLGMDSFPGYGELQAEGCALARRRAHVHFARVLLDDAVAHRKAESGAPSGGLGCEEWIEDAMDMFRRNARSGVDDFDFDGAIVSRGPDFQHAAARHGVARVHEQVEKHLLETRDRAKDRRQLIRIAADDIHARGLEGVLHERQSFLEHGVEIHFDGLGATRTGEIQQVVDDLARAERLLHNALDRLLPGIVRGNLLREHLDVV